MSSSFVPVQNAKDIDEEDHNNINRGDDCDDDDKKRINQSTMHSSKTKHSSGNILTLERFTMIILLFAIGCYLPTLIYFRQSSSSDNSPTSAAFQIISQSICYERALHMTIATMAVSIPLLLEILFDYGLPRENLFPRVLLITGILFPNILRYTSYSMVVWTCSTSSQGMLFVGGLMLEMYNDKTLFTLRRRWFFLFYYLLLGASVWFDLWVVKFGMFGQRSQYYYCKIIIQISLFLCTIVFLRMIIGIARSQRPDNFFFRGHQDCVLYNLLLGFIMFMYSIFAARNAINQNEGSECLFLTRVIIMALTTGTVAVFATMMTGRASRSDRDLAKYLLKTKKQFIRYMSCEYQLSLNAISSRVDEIQEIMTNSTMKKSSRVKIPQLMGDIQRSCDGVRNFLNNTLVVSDLEDKTIQLKPVRMRVVDAINEAVAPILQNASRVKVELNVSRDTNHQRLNTAVFLIDQSLFCLMLRNIIGRAMHISQSNTRPVTIVYYLREIVGQQLTSNSLQVHPTVLQESSENISSVIRIEIADSGPILTEDEQRELLSESLVTEFKLESEKAYHGLGIWVSKQIVKLHGGHLGYISHPDSGSVFFVELNIRMIDATEFNSSISRGVVSSIPPLESMNQNSLDMFTPDIVSYNIDDVVLSRVLLIGLSNKHVNLLKAEFTERVKDVMVVQSFGEGVAVIKSSLMSLTSFNLIILNHTYPNLESFDAISRLRRMGYCGVAVLISHDLCPITNEKFLSCGGDAILLTPLRSDCIERVLIGECECDCLALFVCCCLLLFVTVCLFVSLSSPSLSSLMSTIESHRLHMKCGMDGDYFHRKQELITLTPNLPDLTVPL